MIQSIRFAILLALSPIAFCQPAGAEDAASASAAAAAPAADAAPDQAQATPHVTVVGIKESDDYRVKTTDSLGPLGSQQLLNVPYSVGVLTEDLIQNSMATNFKDVSKYLPLVAYQEQQGADILRPQTRGMQGG